MYLMDHTKRVVIANEERSYREAIALVFERLRADLEVFVIDPKNLDREVKRLLPDLVVCSRLTPRVKTLVSTWVELYPNGMGHSNICVQGEPSTIYDVQLPDLLTLLDQTPTPVTPR